MSKSYYVFHVLIQVKMQIFCLLSVYYFVNVADGIGKDYVFNPQDHPSLKMIDEKQFQKDSFEFKPTNQETVTKVIDKFNPKKATGADKISVKLLKLKKKTH